ncbi:hypothetical protein SAMN05192544_1002228 [Paraburkholderia hospita]|nr:hypothetical protein SAMN05192544_1002228 [Paraburkholderia hospita]
MSGFWLFCWQLRFVFVFQALPVGVLAFCAGIRVTVVAAHALLVCLCVCAGIRVMPLCFKRRPCGFALALASALCLRASSVAPVGLPLRSHPRYAFVLQASPCGFAHKKKRHLLFFAAAKKSRQKKAAHTVSSCSCLRAPEGSYASRGNHVTHVRCQHPCGAPHPPQSPAQGLAAANDFCRPGGKLCVGFRATGASLRAE